MTRPDFGLTNETIVEARLWLGRSEPDFDEEIVQTVQACLMDLRNAGVEKADISDPLIRQAAKLYLKAQMGENDRAPQFGQAYEYLKASLATSGYYKGDGRNG